MVDGMIYFEILPRHKLYAKVVNQLGHDHFMKMDGMSLQGFHTPLLIDETPLIDYPK